MPETPLPPLPENWSERDSHDSFYEYVAMLRQQYLAGELHELPAWLRSTREEREG